MTQSIPFTHWRSFYNKHIFCARWYTANFDLAYTLFQKKFKAIWATGQYQCFQTTEKRDKMIGSTDSASKNPLVILLRCSLQAIFWSRISVVINSLLLLSQWMPLFLMNIFYSNIFLLNRTTTKGLCAHNYRDPKIILDC